MRFSKIDKFAWTICVLALFLSACSSVENKDSKDATKQIKPVFRVPDVASLSNEFSLDGHSEEFEKYAAYQIESDTPNGLESEEWTPKSKDLFSKTTLIIDDNFLYFFSNVTDDDP
ncbi:MAG: hypothetical protein OEQ53_16150, partial [Saprospiraceae bacterium]|nr:hypothetical protein [Saprospiraceae bacterium]